MSYMSFWLICPYIDHTIQVILGKAKTLCQKFSRTSGQFNLPRAAPQWSLHHWYGLVRCWYVLRSCVRSNQSISLGRRELTFFFGGGVPNLLWDASNLLGSWPLQQTIQGYTWHSQINCKVWGLQVSSHKITPLSNDNEIQHLNNISES